MKFMLTFTISPEDRDEAISRFKTTGGRPREGSSFSAAGLPPISAAVSTSSNATMSKPWPRFR